MSLVELKARYDALKQPPAGANRKWHQDRGRELERILHGIFDEAGLSPRFSYLIDGEQIDGSFILNGRVYLLEAKWRSDRIGAADLYTFKGKIGGKLVGTIGVFVSISGFTEDGIDALVKGKSVDLILFDQNDFEKSFDSDHGFRRILEQKLRHAAEAGTPYSPYTVDEVSKGSDGRDEATQKIFARIEMAAKPKYVVITEGPFDARLLLEFVRRLLPQRARKFDIDIVAAGGKMNIPNLARVVLGSENSKRAILVADADESASQSEAAITAELPRDRVLPVVVVPEIEAWLEPSISEKFGSIRDFKRLPFRDRQEFAVEAAATLSISELRARHKSFDVFAAAIEAIP